MKSFDTSTLLACGKKTISQAPVAPRADWREMGEREHFVQFYESDPFLVQSVGDFLAAGLRANDGVLAIATKPHREGLERRLRESGFDLTALGKSGQCFVLDAEAVLEMFMIDGMPDARIFRETVGGVLDQLGCGARRVRAFGEMVAVLFAQGNLPAAIRLEEYWNELGNTRAFSLFCAYPMEGFQGEMRGEPFARVCKHHSRVIPAESYAAQLDADERLRAISLLQQKAGSFDSAMAERKRTENTLRLENAKLNAAVALARLDVWDWEIATDTWTCSDEFRANLGWAAAGQITLPGFLAMVHKDDRDEVQMAFRKAARNKRGFKAEYRIVDSLGKVRWFASQGQYLGDGLHRVVGVTADITAQRGISENPDYSASEQIASLQKATGELQAFAYSVSHDLRAPLRSIQGYASLLMQEFEARLDLDGRTYLGRINASVSRMDQLIRGLLTLTHASHAKLDLHSIDLNSFVSHLLEVDFGPMLGHGIVSIEGDLPTVRGDATSLTQCFSNLMGNAVKFVAPEVQPRVRIWAERMPAPDGDNEARRVRVFVQDNGIGIPADVQDRIFGVFERMNLGYEGNGIGLAIVRKAVERMGGRVGVRSQVGEGSTFWIELIEGDKAG